MYPPFRLSSRHPTASGREIRPTAATEEIRIPPRWNSLGHERGEPFAVGRDLYYMGTLFMSFLVLRPAFSLTLSDLIFAASVIAVIVEAVITGHRLNSYFPPLLVAGVVIFAAGAVLSSALSLYVEDSFLVLGRFVYLVVVWLWLGSVVLRTQRHLLNAVALWMVSCAICGAAAIGQLTQPDLIPGTLPIIGRMTGLTGHPNDLGGLTATAAVPALMMTTLRGSPRGLRMLAYISVALILAGLFLSGSVSGFVAALSAVAMWLILVRVPVRQLMAALGFTGLIATIIAIKFQLSPIQRLPITTADALDPGSTFFGRLTSDQLAWQRILDNPFVGVGLDANSQAVVAGTYIHNMLLAVWVEAGLLGMVGIVVIISQILIVGIKLMRSVVDPQVRFAFVSLVAASVGFLVLGLADPILYQRYAWMAPALLFAACAQRRMPEGERPSSSQRNPVWAESSAILR